MGKPSFLAARAKRFSLLVITLPPHPRGDQDHALFFVADSQALAAPDDRVAYSQVQGFLPVVRVSVCVL